MINNMISIPVHEKTEVVIDQILNYNFFCPDCGIVLHISKGFNYKDSFHDEQEFMFILNQFKNVFVNPTHLDTAFADIIHTHISNFEYISKIVDFEYFSMGSSNDLFVRRMPHFSNCDAIFGASNSKEDFITKNKTNKWHWYEHTCHDKYLKLILDYLNVTFHEVRNSQIEGSTYKKDFFQNIINVITKFYSNDQVYDSNKIVYPREEVYFATVATNLNSSQNLTFLSNNYTFVPWSQANLLPNQQQIIDIAQGKMNGKYSIKRVLRSINDPVRFQIGTQIGNYRDKSMYFIKTKMNRIYRRLFNLASGRKRIFVSYKHNETAVINMFNMKISEIFLTFTPDNAGVQNIVSTMERNPEALFVICIDIYPIVANALTQSGFRENINFIDGTLLLP